MKKYVYEELAIKAIVSALDRMKVEGITQAENLVKVAAILNAGEIIEEKEERKDE
jgi:hypothetical protein